MLSKAFLNKYFPPGKTAKLRVEITSFIQRDGESLYEAWETYKDLQRQCPHHAVPNWLLIQIFYNGLEQSVKISIDATAGGALMGKSIEAAKALLEEMLPTTTTRQAIEPPHREAVARILWMP